MNTEMEKMECNEVIGRLAEYSMGELPEKEIDEIKKHLDVCANCQKEYLALNKTWAILDCYKSEEPILPVLPKVLKTIRRKEKVKIVYYLSPIAAAAVILLVLLPFVNRVAVDNSRDEIDVMCNEISEKYELLAASDINEYKDAETDFVNEKELTDDEYLEEVLAS